MTMAFRLLSKVPFVRSASPIRPEALIERFCATICVAVVEGLISEMFPPLASKTLPVPALMLPMRISPPAKTPRLVLFVVNVEVAPRVIEPWDSKTIEPGPEVRIRSSSTSASRLESVMFPDPL